MAKRFGIGVVLAAVVAVGVAGAAMRQGGGAVVVPQGELAWKDAGVPGVSVAVVAGDMAKGPSRFYLKYKSGLTTPLHHHTADHYVTTVSGTLILTVGGKDYRLPPGSYFAQTDKVAHAAKVEGAEDCVMFIDAKGPWDVVAAK